MDLMQRNGRYGGINARDGILSFNLPLLFETLPESRFHSLPLSSHGILKAKHAFGCFEFKQFISE